MYKFIIKILSFSFIVFGIHLVLDAIITSGLKKNKSNVYEVWNEIYNGEINSDVIINGSSIAEVQISPKIIDSILDVNSYNLGLSGFAFPMQNARYKSYLENTKVKPKMIIQIVGDGTFAEFNELFQTEQFLPYLEDSIIANETKNYKGLDYFDYILPFKRYSAKFKTTFKGIGSFIGYEFLKSKRYKGYLPNEFAWDNKFEAFKKANPNGSTRKINPKYVNLLEESIEKQLAENTDVVLVFPPTFIELKKYMLNRTKILSEYKRIAKKYNIHFLDYSTSNFSHKKDLFYNSSHMNKKGSELFTIELSRNLKSLDLK